MNIYTIEAATEYGIGGSVNGRGKRTKVSGFYVVSPSKRPIRAFTGNSAEIEAQKFADYCNKYPLGTFTL